MTRRVVQWGTGNIGVHGMRHVIQHPDCELVGLHAYSPGKLGRPKVPAANYWSVVLYDADTRALLDNGQPFPSIASNTNLNPNPDARRTSTSGQRPPSMPRRGGRRR